MSYIYIPIKVMPVILQINQVVKMPANFASTKHEFYQLAGMPNVLGAVDCTHVAVTNLQGDVEHVYMNRKT